MTLQKPWRLLKLGSGASYESTFSHDGRLLAVIGRRVSLWDVFERRRLWFARPFAHPSNASFSPDDRTVAVKHTNGLIAILDARDGSLVRDFRNESEGEGAGVSFSPCGKFLVDATQDGDIVVRNARNGTIEFRRATPPEAMIHTITPYRNGKEWLIHFWMRAHHPAKPPRPGYFEIWTWPLGSAPKSRWSTQIGLPAKATPSFDGRRIVMVVLANSRLHLFDAAKRAQVAVATSSLGARSANFTRDGKHVLVCGTDAIGVYDAESSKLKLVRSIALHMASDIAVTHHDLVALASGDAGFVVNPLTAPAELLPVPPHVLRARELLGM